MSATFVLPLIRKSYFLAKEESPVPISQRFSFLFSTGSWEMRRRQLIFQHITLPAQSVDGLLLLPCLLYSPKILISLAALWRQPSQPDCRDTTENAVTICPVFVFSAMFDDVECVMKSSVNPVVITSKAKNMRTVLQSSSF